MRKVSFITALVYMAFLKVSAVIGEVRSINKAVASDLSFSWTFVFLAR